MPSSISSLGGSRTAYATASCPQANGLRQPSITSGAAAGASFYTLPTSRLVGHDQPASSWPASHVWAGAGGLVPGPGMAPHLNGLVGYGPPPGGTTVSSGVQPGFSMPGGSSSRPGGGRQ